MLSCIPRHLVASTLAAVTIYCAGLQRCLLSPPASGFKRKIFLRILSQSHLRPCKFPAVRKFEVGSLDPFAMGDGGVKSRSSQGNDEFLSSSEFNDVESLHSWLQKGLVGGADVLDLWGKAAGTKSVRNLWVELVEGESRLLKTKPPVRIVTVVCVRILNEFSQELIESGQEMANGTWRVRNRPLSEKMKRGETAEDACFRGISEELGSVYGARERVTIVPGSYEIETEERVSDSYPGLASRYLFHKFTASIAGLPTGDFVTEENEHCDEGGASSCAAASVGVRKHFWVWKDL